MPRTPRKLSESGNSTEFRELDKEQRDRYIKKFKELGLSIRQISRLTGISKGLLSES